MTIYITNKETYNRINEPEKIILSGTDYLYKAKPYKDGFLMFDDLPDEDSIFYCSLKKELSKLNLNLKIKEEY